MPVLIRRRAKKERALEGDLRVRGLHHHERVDLRGRRKRLRVTDARASQQIVLIVRFIAFFGAQQTAVSKKRNLHACLDLIVREFLVQVHLKRAVRDEQHVARQQPRLHVLA
jgi:hypothetical protein